MRKLVVVVCAVVMATGLAFAARKPLSSDNPFYVPRIDLWSYICQYRNEYGGPYISTTSDPIGTDDIKFLYLMGFNTQALGQLAQYIKDNGEIIDLETLTQISYWSSPRTLFKLLLIYTFPDEVKLAEAGFFRIPAPSWWNDLP